MSGMPRNSLVGAGLVLVILAAISSGVSNFVNIYAVAGTSSAGFVTVRNLMVAGLLVPVAILSRGPIANRRTLTSRDWSQLVVIGLIGGAIPFLLFFHGLQLATAQGGGVTASFFYRTLFLFATVFAFFFLKERFEWRIVAGAVLLLGGSYLLLSMTSVVWTDGSLYVLAATALWAGEYALSKSLMGHVPWSTVGLGRMGFGAVFLVGYLSLTAQWGAVASFSVGQWDWVLISAALLTIFVGIWYAGLSRVNLTVGTSVLVLGFPLTWLMSVMIQGQTLTAMQALGALGVVLGVGAIVGVSQTREAWTWLRQRLSLGSPVMS